MFSDFRRTFSPTKEETEKEKEFLRNEYNSNEKSCGNCIHYKRIENGYKTFECELKKCKFKKDIKGIKEFKKSIEMKEE